MRRIQILPDSVANQIAAGEVVERPASVVRELVENSLDARAGRIEIGLESGGRRLIRVADDGHGMGREDALLCLDRHATSKIRTARDLDAIRSFGFRGEALPSIAAISRLLLETREDGGGEGTRIRVEGGRVLGIEEAARRRGTTIEARNLFFNAPARARFLRSGTVETRAVADVVTQLSLAHPGVAFLLESDGRVLLDLQAGGGLEERIRGLWGEEETAALVSVRGERAGMRLSGFVQRPDRTGPGFRRVHLFVGGRPIRDPVLVRAADRGYRTTIPEGHRAWLILFLEVPQGSVDVNVHPAKAEVRFRDLRHVELFVEDAVRDALRGEASAAPAPGSGSVPGPTRPAPLAPRRPPERAAQTAFFLPESGGLGPGPGTAPPPTGERGAAFPPADRVRESGAAEGPGTPADSPPSPQGEGSPAGLPEVTRPRLWQVLDRYIVAETRDGLLLVDQHAAHERILFERLMQSFDAGGLEAQQLLFPMTFRLPPAEYDTVLSMKGLFARAGFEVDGFGNGVLAVHAVPHPHPWFDAERALREMIEELTHGSPLLRSARNQMERMAMSFACRAAIKAGQRLGEAEIHELFDALFATGLPFHDVHGRPTTLRLTREDLERSFGRG